VRIPIYGPAIGTHLGKPIFSTIESEDGKFVFDRLAECDRDGCPFKPENVQAGVRSFTPEKQVDIGFTC